MKLKKNMNNRMRLCGLIIISLMLLNGCRHSFKHQPAVVEDKVDSIAFVYDRLAYETFADITAEEFITHGKDPLPYNTGSICIYNRDTIDYLYDRVRNLTSAIDSLSPDIDARAMLVFYRSSRKNDSLFVSAHSGHRMQLNDITKQEDSLLWVNIRDIICERDSIFSVEFKDRCSYYVSNVLINRHKNSDK